MESPICEWLLCLATKTFSMQGHPRHSIFSIECTRCVCVQFLSSHLLLVASASFSFKCRKLDLPRSHCTDFWKSLVELRSSAYLFRSSLVPELVHLAPDAPFFPWTMVHSLPHPLRPDLLHTAALSGPALCCCSGVQTLLPAPHSENRDCYPSSGILAP